MNFEQFNIWLKKLSETDLRYLQKKPGWKKELQKAQQSHILPKGFVEKTMELLEGGSESET